MLPSVIVLPITGGGDWCSLRFWETRFQISNSSQFCISVYLTIFILHMDDVERKPPNKEPVEVWTPITFIPAFCWTALLGLYLVIHFLNHKNYLTFLSNVNNMTSYNTLFYNLYIVLNLIYLIQYYKNFNRDCFTSESFLSQIHFPLCFFVLGSSVLQRKFAQLGWRWRITSNHTF